MTLEIVCHCWHYSRALIFQLSSLVLFPPRDIAVTISVFYSDDDRNTVEVLDFFCNRRRPATVTIRPWPLATDIVTRRMIGRNLAALATEADWVWFTDSDYVFRESCLDSLVRCQPSDNQALFFPQYANISRTHELGDQELLRVAAEVRLVDIQPDCYVRMNHRRAIGGIQIIRGELARRVGYCRSSGRHSVRSSTWVPTHDDLWFRRSLGTRGVPIEMPHLYRIRHSTRGGVLLDGQRTVSTVDADAR